MKFLKLFFGLLRDFIEMFFIVFLLWLLVTILNHLNAF